MAGKRRANGAPETAGDPTPRGKTAKKAKKTEKPGGGKMPRSRAKRIRRVLLWLLVSGLVLVLVAAGGFLYLYKTTDLPDPNADFKTNTSFVYFNDGESEIGRYAVQNRDSIPYKEMPQDVKDAVVAAENRTFWSDSGVDVKGIVRALFNNASGNSTQGASTITQQYIKILYLTQERSYTRKLKEAILSLKLGKEVSKQEVLEGYLNTIYFGRGAYGVQAAAAAYFEKTASELDLRESAVLASVINNPTRLDPANGKDAKLALRERYRYVLGNLAEDGKITQDEADQAARKLPTFPEVEAESTYGGQKGHVLTMVKDELLKLPNKDHEDDSPFTDDEIDGGGLRITTTFTQKAMNAAEQGVLDVRPEGFSDKELHVGVASVQVGTGAVRGIYAGQDYLQSQINWAVAGGMAGSSMKPFALAAALKAGFSLKDTFDGNSPIELPDGTDIENEANDSYGQVNLITATEKSINTAYIDLVMSLPDGPKKIQAMMNAMGIPPAKTPKQDAYGFPTSSPGLAPVIGIPLGNATVSPINMASGYATIANGGKFAPPYIIEKVVDKNGETLYDHSVSDEQVIDKKQGVDIAADVSYAMQQVVKSGTGQAALGLGRPAAGKTGTATLGDDVSSAWFSGFTPQMATSVMYVRGKGVGKLDGWLPSYYGADYPADTWTEVMKADMEGVEEEDFPLPAYVDGEAPDSGHAPTTAPPPPAPTRTPTRQPSSQQPTKTPTNVPTPTIPTPTVPTTSAPVPSATPTPCEVLGTCPTTAPPSTTPPSTAPPTAGVTPAARTWAWWPSMRW